ncbi:MAG: DegV family protein [Clostridia bacterium]|nr:DegV family protein [Clostridia bacterium]
MKIALSCESSADFNKEMYEKNKISVVPFSIILGDNLIPDVDGASKKIFDFVEKTKVLPKTSAVNQEQYKEHFTNLLKEHDVVIHITLSSKISCANSNALLAAKEIGEDRIKIIDSLSLSTGIALLLLYARKLIDNGEDVNTIVKKVEERVPHLQVSFVANNLEYLYKGGRCGTLAYYSANLLKIKPKISVQNGAMVSSKKFFGLFPKILEKYYEDVMQKHNTPDLENVFITYSTAPEQIIKTLQEKLKSRGFKNIFVTNAGGTISSHCGPECLGVLFINDGNSR